VAWNLNYCPAGSAAEFVFIFWRRLHIPFLLLNTDIAYIYIVGGFHIVFICSNIFSIIYVLGRS